MARFTESTRMMGARIRARRKELNWSQDELARRCGYAGRSSISAIEKGGNALNMETVQTIARALDVSPLWIIGEEPATTADVIRGLLDALTPHELETVLTMIKGLVNSHYEER